MTSPFTTLDWESVAPLDGVRARQRFVCSYFDTHTSRRFFLFFAVVVSLLLAFSRCVDAHAVPSGHLSRSMLTPPSPRKKDVAAPPLRLRRNVRGRRRGARSPPSTARLSSPA
jgi:hypothetical protein